MTRTLVLNASYEPLCVVPLRRAVVLVMAQKAEIVADDGTVYRAASLSVAVPRVIRLTRYVRVPYRARVPLTRANLLARDKHTCAYCERKAATVDHVVPRSRGGRHEWTNVVAACVPCNSRKADRLLSELGWVLARTPTAPTGVGWVLVGLAADPLWAPWLPGTGIVAAAGG